MGEKPKVGQRIEKRHRGQCREKCLCKVAFGQVAQQHHGGTDECISQDDGRIVAYGHIFL
jgi:hypothetical protein